MTYPENIGFAIGLLESAAGFGLCFGPIFGIFVFNFGGYTASFLVFAVMFFVICFFIKALIPSSVDVSDSGSSEASEYSYFSLLSNRRILFANFCVLVNIMQYTFIDAILGDRMLNDFGYDEKMTSFMFFFIGLGYSFSCQVVYKTLGYLTPRRCMMGFFIIAALSTFLYGPSRLLCLPPSVVLSMVGLLLSGLCSAHTIVPSFPEMIDAGTNELSIPEVVLNDLSSGLLNLNFAIGEVAGPLIGNGLYVGYGLVSLLLVRIVSLFTCQELMMGIGLFKDC